MLPALLSALACRGQAPPTSPEGPPPAATEVCTLAGGALRFTLPAPEGYAIGRSDELCLLAQENEPIPFFLTLSAIPVDLEGPTRELGIRPDGVVRWVRRAALLGPDPKVVGRERLALASGQESQAFRLIGVPEGFGTRREVLLSSFRVGAYHVVLMGVYEPGDPRTRASLGRLVRAVTLSSPDPARPR